MNKHEIGTLRLKEIVGEKSDEVIQMLNSISPDFSNYILDFAYGDIYARKGFSDKSRELAAVACLIGQGNTGIPLKAHLRGMLNVGWSKEEVIELFIFLIVYIGFPACLEAMMVLKEIVQE